MLENRLDDPRYTYGDYVLWQGDERWELIDGVPFLMSPAPSRWHQEVAGELYRQIATFVLDGHCRAYIAPFDIRLPKSDEADPAINTVVQPDVVVVCDLDKLDDAGCRGAPDWVIEILSPATSVRDQVQKRDLYELNGVREYWVVHPTEKTLTAYRLDERGDRFQPPVTGLASDLRGPAIFPDLEIDWAPVFGR